MKTKGLSLALLAAVLVITGSTAQTYAQEAMVYIVHGIPGNDLGLPENDFPVDVSVDGVCLLNEFTFGEVVGPLELSEGVYNVQISLASPESPCSNAAVIDATVPFAAGESATLIAHLTAEGTPTASKFLNDLSPVHPGRARVILHHTAAAPTVDITVQRGRSRNKLITIEDFSSGDQAIAEINPGNWNVMIAPAGTEDVVFKTRPRLKPYNVYMIYAVGSLDNETFQLIIEKAELERRGRDGRGRSKPRKK